MIHLITYADNNYETAKHRICQEAKNTGWFDTIKGFSPNDLSEDFKNKYSNILKFKRGGGYWIWKYDIISQTLNKINNNDILIYLDAGCSINPLGKKRFREYIHMLNDDNPIISFQLSHLEYKYTTKEIFDYFNVLHDKSITNTGIILNGILIMKKNSKLINLIELWGKTLSDNALLFTDYYNNNNNNQNIGFIDNRHEQSVFSVIRKMNNPLFLKDETWFTPFGNKESLNYPFWATRKSN
jgi:hypothetical protein